MIPKERYDKVVKKEQMIKEEIERVSHIIVGANKKVSDFLKKNDSVPLNKGITLAELICRPELSYKALAELDPERPELPSDVAEQVNINIKYEGYIIRQMKQVSNFKKLENKRLEKDFDYNAVSGLRIECTAKTEFVPSGFYWTSITDIGCVTCGYICIVGLYGAILSQ